MITESPVKVGCPELGGESFLFLHLSGIRHIKTTQSGTTGAG
jgi:hypothetical protein